MSGQEFHPPRSTNRNMGHVASVPPVTHSVSDRPPARPCGDCGRPLSAYNPNTLCAGCSDHRQRLYAVPS